MTLCGPAKKCCHMKYTPPTIADECRCGCGMLNGVFQILCGQFLLFVGFWFSAATVGDCQLVELDEPIEVREDGVLSNQVGLFSYKLTVDETGSDQQLSPTSCYYWYETIVGEEPFEQFDGAEQLQYYLQTVLGSQWYPSILLLSLSTLLALLVFLYVMSYCCSTQVFGIRFFTGLFISIILTLLQGLGTYLIYASEWCNNSGDDEFGGGYCTMGRSTIFSIVASCCYFLSGLFFIFTSDYPGKQHLQELRHDEAAATKQENDRSATVPRAAAPDDADATAADVGMTAAAVTAQSTEEDDEVIYDPPQQQHDDENEEEQNIVPRDNNYNMYEEDTTYNKNKNSDASSASSASSSVLEQHDYLPQQQQQQQQEESAPFPPPSPPQQQQQRTATATSSSSKNLDEENEEILVALTALTTFGKSLHEDGGKPIDPPPQSISIRDHQEEEKQEIVGIDEEVEWDEEAAVAVAMIENTITYQEEEGEEILLLDTLQSQDDEEPSYSFRSLGSSEYDEDASDFIPRPPSPQ